MALTSRDNPANQDTKGTGARARVSMAMPVMRLEVPTMSGYHLHWFANDANRIQRAIAAGYEYVDDKEIELNRHSVAGNLAESGSSDLGSRVVLEGMVLMKLQEQFWDEDTAAYEANQETRLSALRSRGGLDAKDGDNSHRYSNGEQSTAFTLQRRAPKGRSTPL